MQAYCVKCHAKKEMKDPKSITMKNGRPATQGVCPTCGANMVRIGKEAEKQVMKPLEEIQEQVEESQVEAEWSAIKPLAEVLGQAENAYMAYLEAERQVSRI